MENTRETKTITLPSGKPVVLISFMTGREANQVKRVMLKDIMAVPTQAAPGEIPKMPPIALTHAIDREEELIRICVKSVDGTIEGAADLALNLPIPDYTALVTELEKIASGNF